MKAKDVVVGETYLTKIGAALARVVVVRETAGRMNYSTGREGPVRFVVRREGESTPLPKPRAASALRPVSGAGRRA
jgi:hypothetical protein